MDDERGGALKWVALGCGIALLVAVVAVVSCLGVCGACAGGFYAATLAPATVAQEFFQELAQGRLEAAYDKLTPRYRAEHDLEDFQGQVAMVPHLAGAGAASFSRRSLQQDGAVLGGFMPTPDGQLPVQVRLVNEGEQWLVDSFSISGEVRRPPPALPQKEASPPPSLTGEAAEAPSEVPDGSAAD
jgi:hypothetical protein